MMSRLSYRCLSQMLAMGMTAVCGSYPAAGMDVVHDGRPVATIVVRSDGPDAKTGRRARQEPSDSRAAGVLAEWVQKMTGAELPVADTAPKGAPAIYVGAAAIQAGLRLDKIDSPSREGLHVVCDGTRLLLAGQNGTATVKSVCRLLEHWGCRYYMDHPLGEVYPKCKTLSAGKLDIQEKPGMLYRRIWGSRWSGDTTWKIWNGHGGLRLNTGHAWASYVSKDQFDKHPEYFRMRDGRREASGWYCTSNDGLRAVFADGVVERVKAGIYHTALRWRSTSRGFE